MGKNAAKKKKKGRGVDFDNHEDEQLKKLIEEKCFPHGLPKDVTGEDL